MTQAPPPSARLVKPRPGLSGAKAGNPTPQHVLMELKHRILTALGKLADRDTQQIAVEELDKIMETLSPDCVSVCLSCLYDSDMQQKSVVKKECVRLFGSLALLHGDLLIPHLSKIIASIMRRLRDPDSSVRDACVDVMGILSARMLSSSPTSGQENGAQASGTLNLTTFSKPLFDALSEQNKSVQTGAAMCLARVIESAKTPPLGAMARLCPRICKFMSNPNFLARPALLAVMGSLSQVGALAQQHLGMLMPCIHEALENSDWATRKAAAETLTRIGSNLGPALVSFKLTTLNVLESCRFDKVKPVRDSVHDATQLWKNLPGADSESPSSAKKADGQDLALSMQNLELRTSSPAAGADGLGSEHTLDSNSSSPNRSRSSTEKPLAAVKKRAPALIDKKLNPEFFQKLAERNSDDWQIEVAVPRKGPQSSSGVSDIDSKGVDVERQNANGEQGDASGENFSRDVHLASGRRGVETDSISEHNQSFYSDGVSVPHSCGLNKLTLKHETAPMDLDKNPLKRAVDTQAWHASSRILGTGSNGLFEESQTQNESSNWQFMHKQLSQLELQQTNLMQMVQEFMASSQETFFALQARVRGLEKMVEDMACDADLSTGMSNGAFGGFESMRPPGRYFQGHEYRNPRFGKGIDSHYAYGDRGTGPENLNDGGLKRVRHRASGPVPDDWDEYTFGNPRGVNFLDDGQPGPRRNNNGVDREDVGTEPVVTRRGWDRVSGPVRLGEGPSARSVWQASKDEATLAAIRVAGEDAGGSEVDALSSGAAKLATSESASTEGILFKGNGHGKGQFWSLWGSAIEFVQAGDMESAYVEVLCSEDDLMLVRLMSRTGPVLDQLTTGTAGEMLHAVGQLLQQHSYFNICIAWVQQVADMLVSSGADCLELSLDAKKELLVSLQEVVGLDLPEGWLGNSIEQLIQQLANAWSIDIVQVGSDL